MIVIGSQRQTMLQCRSGKPQVIVRIPMKSATYSGGSRPPIPMKSATP